MARLQIKIDRRTANARVQKHVLGNMKKLGRKLVRDLRKEVSVPYPPASQEGEAPHKRTGNLQRGFEFETRTTQRSVSLRVFTDVVYAARLEFGFVGVDRAGRNINQGPRPYWRPVMARNDIGPDIARP